MGNAWKRGFSPILLFSISQQNCIFFSIKYWLLKMTFFIKILVLGLIKRISQIVQGPNLQIN
jgi:hypothetical protein